MEASPFAEILGDLLRRLPGAFACALVDPEGETVDYAGLGDPFDMKVAAAHLRILFEELKSVTALGAPRSIVIRGAHRSFQARLLVEGYALVVLLRKRAGFASSERAFATAERALASEAGWDLPANGVVWHPVRVELDPGKRPRHVGVQRTPLEVLGAVMGLPARQRGFRVRLATGTETTLVREAGNTWYADEPVE